MNWQQIGSVLNITQSHKPTTLSCWHLRLCPINTEFGVAVSLAIAGDTRENSYSFQRIVIMIQRLGLHDTFAPFLCFPLFR